MPAGSKVSIICARSSCREKRQPRTEERKWKYDFTPNGIDLDSFPYGAWRKVTKNVLLDDKKELFQLGDPKGEWELRETISRYLHQARGVKLPSRTDPAGSRK